MQYRLILIFIVVLFQTIFICCNQPKIIKVEKSKVEDSIFCACNPIVEPPPPPDGYVLSTDTMYLTDEKSNNQFTISLIADKQIDMEGQYVQVYRVKAYNRFRNNDFYFALPTRYNLNWQNLTLKKDTIQNCFLIGFKDSNYFQSLYFVSLGAPDLNKGYLHFRPDNKHIPF